MSMTTTAPRRTSPAARAAAHTRAAAPAPSTAVAIDRAAKRRELVRQSLLEARGNGQQRLLNTAGQGAVCDWMALYDVPVQNRIVYFSASIMYDMLGDAEDQARLLSGVSKMAILQDGSPQLMGQLAITTDSTGGTPFLGGCNQIFTTVRMRVNLSSDIHTRDGYIRPIPAPGDPVQQVAAMDGCVPATGLPARIALPANTDLPDGVALPAAVLGVITLSIGQTGIFLPTGSVFPATVVLPPNTIAIVVPGGILYVRADGSPFPVALDLGNVAATTPAGGTQLVVPEGTEVCPAVPDALPAIAWEGRPAQRSFMAWARSRMLVITQCGVIRAQIPLCDIANFDCGVRFEGASSSLTPAVYWDAELNKKLEAWGVQFFSQNTDGEECLPPPLVPDTYGAPDAKCPGYFNFLDPLVGSADKPIGVSIEVRPECVGDLEELARWIENHPDELTNPSELFGDTVCGIDARSGAVVIKTGFWCAIFEFSGGQLTDEAMCACWNERISKGPKALCDGLLGPMQTSCGSIPLDAWEKPLWKKLQEEGPGSKPSRNG